MNKSESNAEPMLTDGGLSNGSGGASEAKPLQAVSDFSDGFRANAKRSHLNKSLISSVVPRDGAVGAFRLLVVPIHMSEANAFVKLHHRHHKPTVGHKFSVAVADGSGKIRGVAIVGRPVARNLDNGWVLEVNRLCTDGTPNACSKLYQAAWRIAREMGYRKLITYTLPEEGGASLRAAGWKLIGERGGGNWNVKSRPRIDTDQMLRGQKLLWQQSESTDAAQRSGQQAQSERRRKAPERAFARNAPS